MTKRIISMLICVLLVGTQSVFAIDSTTYISNEDSITKIGTDKVLSSNIENEVITVQNIICTLFGHDLNDGTIWKSTWHPYQSVSPYCKKIIYLSYHCNRCNYSRDDVQNTFTYNCHPPR